VWILVD